MALIRRHVYAVFDYVVDEGAENNGVCPKLKDAENTYIFIFKQQINVLIAIHMQKSVLFMSIGSDG